MAGPVRPKEFHFPLHVRWDGGRRATARVAGKPPVQIAPPPEFRGTDPSLWSPEDAFVAAAASCLTVTFAGLAERDELPVREFVVSAEGVVGRRTDGRFGFIRIEQTVVVGTDPGHEAAARAIVAKAEDACLVTASLDLPVVTTVEVRTALPTG
jgi:organic hydroperoxide reductase OsmC/OhrA